MGFTVCSTAADYLERVESPVYQATGDHQTLTKHALTCIAQIVKPGMVSAPIIVSSDLEAGVVVANNAFYFASGLIPVRYRARTTLTFQAKDGRFRIVHTSIEAFHDAQGWGGIGLWWGGGGDDAKQALDAISRSVANCVSAPPASDNW